MSGRRGRSKRKAAAPPEVPSQATQAIVDPSVDSAVQQVDSIDSTVPIVVGSAAQETAEPAIDPGLVAQFRLPLGTSIQHPISLVTPTDTPVRFAGGIPLTHSLSLIAQPILSDKNKRG